MTGGKIGFSVSKAWRHNFGLALFEQLHRQPSLTPAGQAYPPPLRDAFGRVAAATDGLKPQLARALIRLGSTLDHGQTS